MQNGSRLQAFPTANTGTAKGLPTTEAPHGLNMGSFLQVDNKEERAYMKNGGKAKVLISGSPFSSDKLEPQ
jgi:hypothetical protein